MPKARVYYTLTDPCGSPPRLIFQLSDNYMGDSTIMTVIHGGRYDVIEPPERTPESAGATLAKQHPRHSVTLRQLIWMD